MSIDYAANSDLYGSVNPLRMEASAAPATARSFVCVIARATGSPTRVCG
ncbi:MAG: hypothetical protein P4L55_21515 [Syntrophobacteraceae bacterium]|nr:hypothetical protein [Syntrophobacteraceae bacterium]